MIFNHLHIHSQFSTLDGIESIESLCKRAVEIGSTALAITDHGSCHGWYRLNKECKKHGLKPIFGCEIYVEHFDNPKRQHHMTVLVQNKKGYENLCTLLKLAVYNFYYKPRIKLEDLYKYNAGLIVTTGCTSSLSSYLISQNNTTDVRDYLNYLQIVFKDRLYAEVQPHLHFKLQLDVNDYLASTDLQLVATTDSHYTVKENKLLHDLMCSMGYGMRLDEYQYKQLSYLHMLSAEECYNMLKKQHMLSDNQIINAINNTQVIADRIDFDFDEYYKSEDKAHFPVTNSVSIEELKEEVNEVLNYNYRCDDALYDGSGGDIVIDERYFKRAKREWQVLERMGFLDYFALLYELKQLSNEHNIPWGFGRGSAAGCLIAYLLGITAIDPIKHDLLFERFLNPARVSLPDIDIDIGRQDRVRFLELLKEHYPSAVQICNYGLLKGKSALKRTAKSLGITYKSSLLLSEKYPEAKQGIDIDLDEAENNEELVNQANELHPKLWQYAKLVEGKVQNLSVHAGGVAFTNSLKVPTHYSKTSILPTCSFDLKETESCNFIKYDFLGLACISLLKACEKQTEISWQDLQPEDPEVFNFICQDDCKGLFQIEAPGYAKFIRDLQPQNIDDIAVSLALYRPGAMLYQNMKLDIDGMHNEYIARKNGKEYSILPELEDILRKTYGIIVYQEQIIKIVQVVAGYSLAEADIIRRLIGKKEVDKIDLAGKEFIDRCIYEQDVATELWQQIKSFARYGFNASHAYAYAYTTYATAYYKYYHFKQFVAAMLSTYEDDTDKLRQVARHYSKYIDAPDIFNATDTAYVDQYGKIRPTIKIIDGVGKVQAKKLIGLAGKATNLEQLRKLAKWKKDSKNILRLEKVLDHDIHTLHYIPKFTKPLLTEAQVTYVQNYITVGDVHQVEDGERISLVCYLVNTDSGETKKGDQFGKGSFYDHTGLTDFVCWSSAEEQCGRIWELYKKPTAVMAECKKSNYGLSLQRLILLNDTT